MTWPGPAPEEMASAIFYLASDESSFTTGIDLVADAACPSFDERCFLPASR
jgi:NAD(P)-dependent dehydrogenase (short-subunit alcohol dehydrogenase family)